MVHRMSLSLILAYAIVSWRDLARSFVPGHSDDSIGGEPFRGTELMKLARFLAPVLLATSAAQR
jgi:hypothetical protein